MDYFPVTSIVSKILLRYRALAVSTSSWKLLEDLGLGDRTPLSLLAPEGGREATGRPSDARTVDASYKKRACFLIHVLKSDTAVPSQKNRTLIPVPAEETCACFGRPHVTQETTTFPEK